MNKDYATVSNKIVLDGFRKIFGKNFTQQQIYGTLISYGCKPVGKDKYGRMLFVYGSDNYDEITIDSVLNKIFDERTRKQEKEVWPDETENCRAPEEDMEWCINNIGIEESKMKKRIFLTESQAKMIEEMILEEDSSYPVNPNKVKVVSNYLDSNFQRGGISAFSEDGYPKTICIVGMKGTDGKVARNMDAKQLFYLLQDKFKDIYLDTVIRDKFLKQVMKDWYDKKITKQGLLSVNIIK